jgi:hypothetical protein
MTTIQAFQDSTKAEDTRRSAQAMQIASTLSEAIHASAALEKSMSPMLTDPMCC